MRHSIVWGGAATIIMGVLAAGGAAVHSVLQGTTGARWTAAVGRSPSALAVDTQSGHIFVANLGERNHAGTMMMIDETAGTLLHTTIVGVLPTDIVIDGRGTCVYVTNDKSVSVLDARSGRLVRSLGPYAAGVDAVASDEGIKRIFVAIGGSGGAPGVLHVFNTARGTSIRTIPIDTPFALAIDDRLHHVLIATNKPPTRLGYTRGGITVLDGWSGRILRQISLGSAVGDVQVDALRGRAFVLGTFATANGGSSVSVIDTRTTRLLYTIGVGQSASAMALDPGTGHVFVGVSMGAGYGVGMLDARHRWLAHTAHLRQLPTTLAVSTRVGRIFVLNNEDSTIYVLDTTSGAVVRTFQMIHAPNVMAIDDHAGRVIIGSRDVSDGVASGIHLRSDGPIDDVAHLLYNIQRLHQTGKTGTISVFDTHAVR